jgi:hypothetical protein
MNQYTTFRRAFLFTCLLFTAGLEGQNLLLIDNPGKYFKKQEFLACPPIKTKYQFETGTTTGREFLYKQDLIDPKGKYKSSGIFSEDGNKAADNKYVYDAGGKLLSQETRFIGQNLKEVTTYNGLGKPEKIERKTKGDTLLSLVSFVYSESGVPLEEHYFKNGQLSRKRIFEDVYSKEGKLISTCHYELDSTGNRKPGNYPLTVNEYDDQGLILQTTVYSNKEKRKMLSWVYYKYQLDNDYKIIKQSGFNEEQQEIYRNELVYSDSSITSIVSKVCSCPAKTLEKINGLRVVYNAHGVKSKEEQLKADGSVSLITTWKYDDFGTMIEQKITNPAEPAKLNKSKTILEYYTDQASVK